MYRYYTMLHSTFLAGSKHLQPLFAGNQEKGYERGMGMDTLKPGRYRHFKGKEYEVIGVAKHSETLEEYVVYRALYGDGGLWVRPRTMFEEQVEVDGELKPRFVYIG